MTVSGTPAAQPTRSTPPAPSSGDGAVHGLRHVIREVATDIKLAHSVFALPFALLGAMMAAAPVGSPVGSSVDWRRLAGQLVLVVLAMIFARTAAMLANRLLDHRIDARNPRTASRAIPSGRLPVRAAVVAMALNAVAFMLVCAGFGVLFANWWPLILGMPVLVWICAYGIFKRFTALCHVYLGSGLALSPLAAAIAVDPAALAQPALWLVSLMVLCWVAGFDVIYALQDVEVDRAERLYSMPSRLGVPTAMRISRALHGVAVMSLIVAGWVDPRFGWLFAMGVACVAGLLLYEHATVARWGTTKLALAFFTLNGILSCLLGSLAILDLLI